MIGRLISWHNRGLGGWLFCGMCLSIGALAWLGYQAIAEWHSSAILLTTRRADATADLLVTALTRDMRGVQSSVLLAPHPDEVTPNLALDVNYRVASAFARYPYPEVFFSWRGPAMESVLFYSRAERPLIWAATDRKSTRFPVVLSTAPDVASRLRERIARDTSRGRRFSVFDLRLGTTQYQVVAVLSYSDIFREQVDSVFGFMVNLDWVRQHYFQEITGQVARIAGMDDGLVLTVYDPHGTMVGSSGPDAGTGRTSRRVFSLEFFDPLLIAVDPPEDVERSLWIAQANIASDPALLAANQGARRTLAVTASTAVVLMGALIAIVQTARTHANLVALRSDFVSTVTHDLKAPVAAIRAICQTLSSGRSGTPEMSREYAQLAVHEAKRLTRLIDNLLAYARITDITDVYAFENVAVEVVVNHTVREFSSRLNDARFTVVVDIPPRLPMVRCDRSAMALLLDNLVDNAIRYSHANLHLQISARLNGEFVVIDVIDQGVGIPSDQLPHVTRKFFRGRNAISGGSGLGLAIAHRIAHDHGGSLTIHSTVNVGTTVTVSIPVARTDDEEARARS